MQVLNRAAVLERLDGDEDLYQEIIAVFLEDTPNQLEALKAALEAGDQEASRRYAHSLKSACANIGGDRMSQLARQMEHQADRGDLGSPKEQLPLLIEEFEQLKVALSA